MQFSVIYRLLTFENVPTTLTLKLNEEMSEFLKESIFKEKDENEKNSFFDLNETWEEIKDFIAQNIFKWLNNENNYQFIENFFNDESIRPKLFFDLLYDAFLEKNHENSNQLLEMNKIQSNLPSNFNLKLISFVLNEIKTSYLIQESTELLFLISAYNSSKDFILSELNEYMKKTKISDIYHSDQQELIKSLLKHAAYSIVMDLTEIANYPSYYGICYAIKQYIFPLDSDDDIVVSKTITVKNDSDLNDLKIIVDKIIDNIVQNEFEKIPLIELLIDLEIGLRTQKCKELVILISRLKHLPNNLDKFFKENLDIIKEYDTIHDYLEKLLLKNSNDYIKDYIYLLLTNRQHEKAEKKIIERFSELSTSQLSYLDEILKNNHIKLLKNLEVQVKLSIENDNLVLSSEKAYYYGLIAYRLIEGKITKFNDNLLVKLIGVLSKTDKITILIEMLSSSEKFILGIDFYSTEILENLSSEIIRLGLNNDVILKLKEKFLPMDFDEEEFYVSEEIKFQRFLKIIIKLGNESDILDLYIKSELKRKRLIARFLNKSGIMESLIEKYNEEWTKYCFENGHVKGCEYEKYYYIDKELEFNYPFQGEELKEYLENLSIEDTCKIITRFKLKRKIRLVNGEIKIFESNPFPGFEEINLSSLSYYENILIEKFIEKDLNELFLKLNLKQTEKDLLMKFIQTKIDR